MTCSGITCPNGSAHEDVILICMNVWHYARVCRFFTLGVEEAARHVAGPCRRTTPWTQPWPSKPSPTNGTAAPTENCHGDWTTDDIPSGNTDHTEGR